MRKLYTALFETETLVRMRYRFERVVVLSDEAATTPRYLATRYPAYVATLCKAMTSTA